MLLELRWTPIFRRTWRMMLRYTVIGATAVVLHQAAAHPEEWGVLGSSLYALEMAAGVSSIDVPFGVIGALGSVLGIFLAFRNNSAYDRWWEARKLWGRVVNDSRNFVREALTLVRGGDDPAELAAIQRELALRHVAWVHALRFHLRKQPELLVELEPLLPADEYATLATSNNVPNRIVTYQGKRIAELRDRGLISEFAHIQLDSTLNRLLDHQGGCERIKNTPVPRQYDVFPRKFTAFYVTLLPFGLTASLGWFTVPISVGVSYMFLMLEGSGRIIEDPFENRPMDTPLTALSTTIERNIREMIDDPHMPAPTTASDYVLM